MNNKFTPKKQVNIERSFNQKHFLIKREEINPLLLLAPGTLAQKRFPCASCKEEFSKNSRIVAGSTRSVDNIRDCRYKNRVKEPCFFLCLPDGRENRDFVGDASGDRFARIVNHDTFFLPGMSATVA